MDQVFFPTCFDAAPDLEKTQRDREAIKKAPGNQ